MKKIAVIDNYDSFVYNLVRYVREVENLEIKVMRNDEIDYDYLKQVDGILLSPGPGIPSEAGDLIEVIKTFHAEKNILGICLGHQAIGEFFKGRLEKSPQIYHGKATVAFKTKESPLFENVTKQFDIGRYHSWQIHRELPYELTPTVIDDGKHVMAFQHISLPIYGIQFHPESVLTPAGRTIIKNWITTCNKY